MFKRLVSIRQLLGVQHILGYVIAKTLLVSLYTLISFYRSTVLIQATNKQCEKFGPKDFDLSRGNCILTC